MHAPGDDAVRRQVRHLVRPAIEFVVTWELSRSGASISMAAEYSLHQVSV
jgi:hypothetical protein